MRGRAGPTDTPQVIFDPTLCPLLDGLSPEEQAERMETDPVIRACVRKMDSGADQLSGCHVTRAYASRATKRSLRAE